MRIAVVGSGPAGLLAAHEAFRHTDQVDIFSLGEKSMLYGAQYLHAPIDGITAAEPEVHVDYKLKGTVLGYRTKVYGSNWEGRVSPDEYGSEESHPAWDIRRAYSTLWRLYSSMVQQAHVKPNWLRLNSHSYDVILYSAPAMRICDNTGDHSFEWQSVYAMGDAPDLKRYAPSYGCPDNTILCSGLAEDEWYRVSSVLGYVTAEYPVRGKVPPPGAVAVRKPLRHNCTCFPEVVRIGRYGAWKKGYLVHEVQDHVRKVLS